jgi:hypothetical protein
MLIVGMVVLGVSDMRRAADFWSQAPRYVPRDGEIVEDRAVSVPAAGTGAPPALGLSATPVREYPRLHLDLYAGDQAAEVERLVSLGAVRVDWDLYPDDGDFIVLGRPGGRPLLRRRHPSRMSSARGTRFRSAVQPWRSPRAAASARDVGGRAPRTGGGARPGRRGGGDRRRRSGRTRGGARPARLPWPSSAPPTTRKALIRIPFRRTSPGPCCRG